MKSNNIISTIGVVIQALAIVCAGIYAVSELKSETRSLGASIRELNITVRELGDEVKSINNKYVDHEIRVRMLEAAKS